MSIFQSLRNYIDEVKQEMEETEKRNQEKINDTVSSDEFLERLEEVRQSNRTSMDPNTGSNVELATRSERRNIDKQRQRTRADRDGTGSTNQDTRMNRDSSASMYYEQENYYEDYYSETETQDSLSTKHEIDSYHSKTRQKMKESAQSGDFWSQSGRIKKRLKNSEKKELLRQGMIMKEILDAPRSKKRRIR